MKKEISITVIILTTISIVIAAAMINNTVLDIQLYDTYFVLDRLTIILLIVAPIISIICLIMGIINRFKTIWTNLGMIVGLILSGYLSKILINLGLSWVWVLLFAEGFFAVFLIIRTYKIIRD